MTLSTTLKPKRKSNPADLTGKVYGMWTVVARSDERRKWVCRCECGTVRAVYDSHLKSGASQGCSRRGHKLPTTTPGYSSWAAMKERCLRPKHPAYHRYGGRGITVCARWLEGFETFHADMGLRPDGMSLERIDTDGNYEPSNCRWATPVEQQNNTRSNRHVDIDGESLTIAQLAASQGVKYQTAYSRLKRKGLI